MRLFMRAWAPVLIWLGLIAWNSTGFASAEHVRQMAMDALRLVGASVDLAGGTSWLDRVLLALRKPAHLFQYGVLAVLAYRALRSYPRRGTAAAAGVFGVVIAVAVLDEVHQHTVPSRTGSPRDVAIDAVGAGLGLLLAVAVAARRGRSRVAA